MLAMLYIIIFQDKSSKLWREDLGTITMECLEAIEDGYYQTRRKEFRQNRQPTNLSHDPTHYQATKQDCSKKGQFTYTIKPENSTF